MVARRFVRSVLDRVPPDMADTAELLVGELVTNAVIHARTEIEVLAWVVEGRAHVRVSDHRTGQRREVLRRLDLASHTLNPHSTATCVSGLAKCEGDGVVLHHSSAGHLPPLLTTREGETRYLDAGRGLLIGMDPGVPRLSARDPLPPGSALLLFTDGLIERRGESLDEAMARLRRHTAGHSRAPLDVSATN